MSFRALHYGQGPLLLPDAGSAVALADRCFLAVGTTSLGVGAWRGCGCTSQPTSRTATATIQARSPPACRARGSQSTSRTAPPRRCGRGHATCRARAGSAVGITAPGPPSVARRVPVRARTSSHRPGGAGAGSPESCLAAHMRWSAACGGQEERAVKPSATPSVVRIHHPPHTIQNKPLASMYPVRGLLSPCGCVRRPAAWCRCLCRRHAEGDIALRSRGINAAALVSNDASGSPSPLHGPV
jgi:hypothetical protein